MYTPSNGGNEQAEIRITAGYEISCSRGTTNRKKQTKTEQQEISIW